MLRIAKPRIVNKAMPIPRQKQKRMAKLIGRFAALPADSFPNTRRYAAELTSGVGHDRFDFTLNLIIDNLAPGRPVVHRPE